MGALSSMAGAAVRLVVGAAAAAATARRRCHSRGRPNLICWRCPFFPACGACCSLRHAALVCKRFRSLCLSPPLLRKVTVRVGAAGSPLPHYRALLSFLAAHAAHVHCLELHSYSQVGVVPRSDMQ